MIMSMEARRSTTEKPWANLVSRLRMQEDVPPEDSKNVSDQKDQADEGREAVRVPFFLDRVALDEIPEAGTDDHA